MSSKRNKLGAATLAIATAASAFAMAPAAMAATDRSGLEAATQPSGKMYCQADGKGHLLITNEFDMYTKHAQRGQTPYKVMYSSTKLADGSGAIDSQDGQHFAKSLDDGKIVLHPDTNKNSTYGEDGNTTIRTLKGTVYNGTKLQTQTLVDAPKDENEQVTVNFTYTPGDLYQVRSGVEGPIWPWDKEDKSVDDAGWKTMDIGKATEEGKITGSITCSVKEAMIPKGSNQVSDDKEGETAKEETNTPPKSDSEEGKKTYEELPAENKWEVEYFQDRKIRVNEELQLSPASNYPKGTKFSFVGDVPDWVTIDEDTGKVTINLFEDEKNPKEYEFKEYILQVKATFPDDGGESTGGIKFSVVKSDADNNSGDNSNTGDNSNSNDGSQPGGDSNSDGSDSDSSSSDSSSSSSNSSHKSSSSKTSESDSSGSETLSTNSNAGGTTAGTSGSVGQRSSASGSTSGSTTGFADQAKLHIPQTERIAGGESLGGYIPSDEEEAIEGATVNTGGSVQTSFSARIAEFISGIFAK